MKTDLARIVGQFRIYGDFLSAESYGTGHINDTFLVTCSQAGRIVRYCLQRINHSVFQNPPDLMNNVVRVTEHIRKKRKQADAEEISRRVLTVVLTHDGAGGYRDPEGSYWRVFLFIEGARTYDVIESLDMARQAARAFGEFQADLADLPQPPLADTIPDFHNAQKRYKTFLEVLEKDPCNRAASAKPEIDFLNTQSGLFEVLPKQVREGQIPIRTTHNDTKINNIMIDNQTHQAICVIDLDTVMPGLSLYDFGDIVRTTASNSPEDETDLSKVNADPERFEAVLNGYMEGAGGFLNQSEIDHLVHSGKLITMVIGTRFLTDYLDGDRYFKTHRNRHNLDRCRTQFKLVRSLAQQEEELNEQVRRCGRQQIKG